MATTEELTALLAEAEKAYHDLVMGVSVRIVAHQNGTRVEYTPASRPALRSYINELKMQIGGSTTGPMKVFF